MTALKAIETTYNGYRFRSRLEARWSVFLDRLNVIHEYEPEGFDLSGVPQQDVPLVGKDAWYLPDFWLPTQRSWVEVKPVATTPIENERMARLAVASGLNVINVVGQPWIVAEEYRGGGYDEQESGFIYFGGEDSGWDNHYLLTACPFCGRVDWCFEGYADRLKCACPNERKGVGDFARVQRAYLAARSARFEFGQTPKAGG